MIAYRVQPKQTLFDVVIQTTGTLEALAAVAYANDMAVSDSVTVGQTIMIPLDVATDAVVVAYFAANEMTVGTLGAPVANNVPFILDELGNGIIDENGNNITS